MIIAHTVNLTSAFAHDEETTFEYVLHNNTSDEYRTGHNLEVYVDNMKAEHYYNLDEKPVDGEIEFK